MPILKRSLRAVMAYESASTPERASQAWDYLVCTLTSRYGSRVGLWQFERLRNPDIRGIAAADAARADMILIATRGAGELPAEVREWIDAWLSQKCEVHDDHSALTVLFDVPRDGFGASALPQFAYLQRVARKGNMDFFVSTFDQPEEMNGLFRLQFTQPHGSLARNDSNGRARRKPFSFVRNGSP
jgi:hypothetical protein